MDRDCVSLINFDLDFVDPVYIDISHVDSLSFLGSMEKFRYRKGQFADQKLSSKCSKNAFPINVTMLLIRG